MTAHGPYYINLYSLEEEKLEASRKRVLDTARALQSCGGDGACFHPGFYQKRDAAEVYAFMTKQVGELADILAEERCPVRLDPETTQGLRCRACGQVDEEATGWFLAEEEGPLEELVLLQRARKRKRKRKRGRDRARA